MGRGKRAGARPLGRDTGVHVQRGENGPARARREHVRRTGILQTREIPGRPALHHAPDGGQGKPERAAGRVPEPGRRTPLRIRARGTESGLVALHEMPGKPAGQVRRRAGGHLPPGRGDPLRLLGVLEGRNRLRHHRRQRAGARTGRAERMPQPPGGAPAGQPEGNRRGSLQRMPPAGRDSPAPDRGDGTGGLRQLLQPGQSERPGHAAGRAAEGIRPLLEPVGRRRGERRERNRRRGLQRMLQPEARRDSRLRGARGLPLRAAPELYPGRRGWRYRAR